MNAVASLYYPVVVAAILWLLILGVGGIFLGAQPARSKLFGAGVVAFALCFVPIGGLPLWRLGFGLWPNPSLPLVGLMIATLSARVAGRTLFTAMDRESIWIFGAVAGSILYLHNVVPLGADLYYWGWDSRVMPIGVGLVAVGLLRAGYRLGALLLLAMIAFAAGALESTNLWDYVVDPVYWLISLGVVTKRAVGAWKRRRSPGGETTTADRP